MPFYKTLILLLFRPCLCFGQNDTSYFDKDWNEIPGKDSAVYFRPPVKKIDNNKYEVKDYYMATGNLQYEGTCLDEKLEAEDGYVIYYYENSNKESEGLMVNDDRTGLWKFYRENGVLESYCNYKNDHYHGEIAFFYPNGVMKRQEFYKAGGIFISGKCFTPDGKDTAFFMNRSAPSFPGGNEKYTQYINNNKQFRKFKQQNKNIKGEVVIEASVDEQGKIYDTKFIQRLHPQADTVFLNMVLPIQLLPALDDYGKPVKSTYNLDVKFE
jgi:hypothetical protein